MNILVLNYEYPPLGGGGAPVSRDIANQLGKLGHNIVLLTMGFGDLPEYEEQGNVKVYRLKCWRKRSDACQPWEQLSYLLAVRKFMAKHKELKKYDVCHAHFVIPTGEVAYHLYKKYNIPYIITAHGSDVEGHNKKNTMIIMHRLLRSSWKKIVNHSFGVAAPSIYLANLMKSNNSAGKYFMIPNGIDINKYKILGDTRNKEQKILIMGRLQKFKNVQTILRALSMIDLSNWHVDVLGDGPYCSELQKLSQSLGLSEYVTFHGWITNNSKEQLEFISEASIYISASQFENCPMSVIETTAAGCYPILSDIPAHRQLLGEGDFYFQTEDTEQLSKKIEERIKLGAKRCSLDLERYDWSHVIPKYEELLINAQRCNI